MKVILQNEINHKQDGAIKCICVDMDKESRTATARMIGKAKWLHLVRSCASLDAALTICRQQKIDILFIRLYMFPVPAVRIKMLRQIAKQKTKIVILTNQIKIVRSVLMAEFNNFLHLPTTSRGLCKASMKALQIKEFAVVHPEAGIAESDNTMQ